MSTRKPPVYVIATRKDYDYFLRNQIRVLMDVHDVIIDDTEMARLSRPDQIRGIRRAPLYVYGSIWETTPDTVNDMLDEAQVQGFYRVDLEGVIDHLLDR